MCSGTSCRCPKPPTFKFVLGEYHSLRPNIFGPMAPCSTPYPWLTIASFAVVVDDERLISVGRVWHWRLSSYSAELWAILVASAGPSQPVVIHSDSPTIVQQYMQSS